MEYSISASTSKKMIAKYIDGMLSLIIVMLIQQTILLNRMEFFEFLSHWLAIAFVYNLVFTTGGRNTLGRFLMKVRIVEENGSALTLKKAFIRQFVAIISLAVFCIGYFISIFHDKKLTLHDRLVGTKVVDLAI